MAIYLLLDRKAMFSTHVSAIFSGRVAHISFNGSVFFFFLLPLFRLDSDFGPASVAQVGTPTPGSFLGGDPNVVKNQTSKTWV